MEKTFSGQNFVFLRLRQHPFLHKTKGPTRNLISPPPPPPQSNFQVAQRQRQGMKAQQQAAEAGAVWLLVPAGGGEGDGSVRKGGRGRDWDRKDCVPKMNRLNFVFSRGGHFGLGGGGGSRGGVPPRTETCGVPPAPPAVHGHSSGLNCRAADAGSETTAGQLKPARARMTRNRSGSRIKIQGDDDSEICS